MADLIMRFVLLFSHLIYAIKILSKQSVNVYGNKTVMGNPATIIAVILLIGGVLSPFFGSLVGWGALGIAIVIGLSNM